MDRQRQHQGVADEELRHGDEDQRHGGNGAIGETLAPQRGVQAEHDRQRHGDHRRRQREHERVLQSARDELDDGLAARERSTEIAAHEARDPIQVSDIGRTVEAQIAADRRDGFRGRLLAQDRLRHIARQQLGPDEDQDRDRDQGQDGECRAVKDEAQQHRPSPLHQTTQTRSATRMPDMA